MSIDNIKDDKFAPIADAIASVIFFSVPITEGLDLMQILVWLSGAALFFTFYLGFIEISRRPKRIKRRASFD